MWLLGTDEQPLREILMDIIQELQIAEVIKQLTDDGISHGEIRVLIEDHIEWVLSSIGNKNA